MMKLTIDGCPNIENNKYFKWYRNLIIKRLQTEPPVVYCEKHHILPTSMGGTNNTNNLVKLTAREHFIAHLLLAKFTIGASKSSMLFALSSMSMSSPGTKNRYFNSKLFDKHRKELSLVKTELALRNSPFKNKNIHKKTMQSRRENGTNIFVTNNPMLNEESLKKWLTKTSGEKHYTKNKLCYLNMETGRYLYFKDDPGAPWKQQHSSLGKTTKAKGKPKNRIQCAKCDKTIPSHLMWKHTKARHENK